MSHFITLIHVQAVYRDDGGGKRREEKGGKEGDESKFLLLLHMSRQSTETMAGGREGKGRRW